MDQSLQQIQITTKNIEDQDNQVRNFIAFFIKFIFILLPLLFLFFSRKKRDLKKEQIKQLQTIPKQKIIVALQIKDFFVNLINKFQNGYEQIQLNNNKDNVVWKTITNFLGFRIYFKSIFSIKQIQNFIKGLKSIKDVQVMIYTSLHPGIAEFLLKKLKIMEFFPPKYIKYCTLSKQDMLKHAIDVDKDTRRVIIVTPNKNDHSSEHENYFLVLKPKLNQGKNSNYLREHLRFMKTLFESNTNRDTLHDQLYQLKIDIQDSDYSDVQRNHHD